MNHKAADDGEVDRMERDALVATMRSMRAEVEQFVAERLAEPDAEIGGGWTLHDVVAHLALWDRMAVRGIARIPLPEGEEVASREPWDLDAFNDEMRARFRDRPMPAVMAEFEASFRAVVNAVQAADDESCAPGGTTWTVVDDDSAGHYPVHVPVRDLMAERSRT